MLALFHIVGLADNTDVGAKMLVVADEHYDEFGLYWRLEW